MLSSTKTSPPALMPGDLVEVRSAAEILGTLDDKGTLQNLPFMPEMIAYSGRQFRVSRRAFKTCVDDREMRELHDTVFLEDVRCDGQSHGGCDKACLIFWKDDWLRRVGEPSTNGHSEAKLKEADLFSLASRNGDLFCQSSEIVNASTPLPWWKPKQYIRDLRGNGISFAQWLESLYIAVYNKLAHVGGFKSWKFVAGPGTYNGTREALNLKRGDLVRVKSLSQITATLDADGKHQNLLFAPAMAEFCGREMRVQNRVEKIILEGTSRQRRIKDTVLLEGSTCDGICHRMCPRQSLLFWRECWLERVNGS